MFANETICLPCPNCHAPIYRPLPWFKRSYGTCPACAGGLAAGQFETAVAAIEEAFDARIEEMMAGPPVTGCGGGCGKCG